MKRYPVSGRKDKKIFSRTAQKYHPYNETYIAPMRGGRRM